MEKKPIHVSSAPSSMAVRAETMFFSRSRPAGKAIPAWNTAQMVTIQTSGPAQRAYPDRVLGGPVAVFEDADAHIASQGSQTIQALDIAEQLAVGLTDAVDATVRVGVSR